MPDRKVVFTEEFFDHLELLLPPERGYDSTPSVTDFLVFALPTVRDELVRDYEGRTTATDDPDIRV